jgi:hypothetical protein
MFIKPTAIQYNPEDDLRSSGVFYAVCSDVKYNIENRDTDRSKPNCAIEFIIVDKKYPHLVGKKTAIVCSQSVYRDKKNGKESNLVVHARAMGVVKPELGFDCDVFKDKFFDVECELYNGKAYVRFANPAPSPNAEGWRPGSDDMPDVPNKEELPF